MEQDEPSPGFPGCPGLPGFVGRPGVEPLPPDGPSGLISGNLVNSEITHILFAMVI